MTEQLGGAIVTATDYGNPVTYTPDDRPANAMDGDPESAWRVGALADPTGERLIIDLRHPVTTDHLQLLQPINLVRNRWLTKVTLHFDDQKPVTVDARRPVPRAAGPDRPLPQADLPPPRDRGARRRTSPSGPSTTASAASASPRCASPAWPRSTRSCARRPTC